MAMASRCYQSLLCQIRHLNMNTTESMLQKQTVLKCIYVECAEQFKYATAQENHENRVHPESIQTGENDTPPRMVQMQMISRGLKKKKNKR